MHVKQTLEERKKKSLLHALSRAMEDAGGSRTQAGMAETDRNGPNFNPRWNIRVFRIGLLTGMKRPERNGILNYGFHSHIVPSMNTV
uniref:Uncharacterized protein n=1 Tax=Fagus sylvatica TaxID=28930 RepID=A0A2N9J845_FAGSY